MVTMKVTTFKDKKIDFDRLAREVNRGRPKPRMTCAKAHLFQGMRDPLLRRLRVLHVLEQAPPAVPGSTACADGRQQAQGPQVDRLRSEADVRQLRAASFPSVNSDWGTCMVNQYQHEKHTGPERDLSINKYGKCAVEGEGGYEKNVSAYERLGRFAELVEVA